jgi:hypothetical protein
MEAARIRSEMLSPSELAEILGVTESTLATWRSIGKGPPYMKAGNIFYAIADVQHWIRSTKVVNHAHSKTTRQVALPILAAGRREDRKHRFGRHRKKSESSFGDRQREEGRTEG